MPYDVPNYRPPRLRVPRPPHRRVYGTDAWRVSRAIVLQRDQWTCTECGKELHGQDATVDHVHEMQHGGAMLPTIDGLRALCRACNSRKGRRGQMGVTPA